MKRWFSIPLLLFSAPALAQGIGAPPISTQNFQAAFIGRQTFCASGCSSTGGTYTATAGATVVDVTCVGGGGAGGGSATTGAGAVSAGGGGGSAGTIRKRFTTGFSGVTVTIGGGGTGVANGTGNNGGDTTFGALLTAPHGTGGLAGPAASAGSVSGGNAGSPSGGDLNVPGQQGFQAVYLSAATGLSGSGGDTPFGSGGPGVGTTSTLTGTAGTGYGSGGSGGVNGPSQAATTTGGAGAGGYCLVDEYR